MAENKLTETIKSARELCVFYMQQRIPVLLSGPPGVGKSDLWAQIAKSTKQTLIDLRLGCMDPVDLLGLQSINNGVTQWNRPAWMPKVGSKEPCIILFDEIADISRVMQSAAYQLILNGRAGPHELGENCYRCAAGNRREDRAAAVTMSTALANRFAHVDVRSDPEAFIEWCNANDIDPLIPGFIRFRPALLYSMEGADLRAFPTPRAWARVAKCVHADASLRFRLVAGLVGEGAAGEFEVYMKGLNLPSLDEILANPKKAPIPKEPSSKYALSSMLARYATRQNFAGIVSYVQRSEFGRDFETVTALDATKRDSTLCDTKAWLEWANKNNDLHL
jgi:dynein-related subfamily AAA family protein